MSGRLPCLDAGRRVAFEIRYAAAVSFGECSLPSQDGRAEVIQREKLLNAVNSRSNIVRVDQNAPWQEALGEVIGYVNSVDLGGSEIAMQVVRQRAANFNARLEDAARGDRSMVPSELRYIFCSIDRLIHDLYSAVPYSLEKPNTILAVKSRDRDDQDGLLGLSAIDGSCKWDDGESNNSIVVLNIRDDAFDWHSACHLPYVIAHELLCHAYQGIVNDEEFRSREQVDRCCAWSEGWMDIIALWVIEEWINGKVGERPDWICSAQTQIRAASYNYNTGRAGRQSKLSAIQRSRRISARNGVDKLLAEMAKFEEENSHNPGRSVLMSFSLMINAIKMPQSQRDRFVDGLCIALETTFGLDRDELLSAIMDFTTTGNELRLRRAFPFMGY